MVGVPKEPIPEPEPEPEEGPFYRNIPYREYHPYRNEGEEYKQRRMVKTMRQFRVDSMPYEQDQKDILIDQLQQKMKSKEVYHIEYSGQINSALPYSVLLQISIKMNKY